jgi:hypothetical protein
MDCKTARLLLEVAHPLATELDAHDKEQLAVHLADCPECGAWAESERLADEHLGAAMRDVPVPDGLKFRVLNRLNKERDAWYRGWVVRAAGVAAAVLLLAFVAYGVWRSNKPKPNIEEVRDRINIVFDSPERVEEEFAARGVHMIAPPQFKYGNGLLHSFGMTNFQGKQVPYLIFFNSATGPNDVEPALAKVFVLSDRQFNLDAFRNSQDKWETKEFAGSAQNILVEGLPENPHVLYVITYTCKRRGTFERIFLKPRAPQG